LQTSAERQDVGEVSAHRGASIASLLVERTLVTLVSGNTLIMVNRIPTMVHHRQGVYGIPNIPNITRGLLAMTDTTSTISKVSMAQKSTSTKAPPAVAMAGVLLHPGYDAMKDTLAAESSLTSLHKAALHILHMDIRVILQLDALAEGPSVPTAGCLRD